MQAGIVVTKRVGPVVPGFHKLVQPTLDAGLMSSLRRFWDIWFDRWPRRRRLDHSMPE
jgi:hypothetical protein